MERSKLLKKWFTLGVVLMFALVSASCAVRTHARTDAAERNKTVVASAPATENKAAKPKVEKRTRVAKSDKKNANSSSAPAAMASQSGSAATSAAAPVRVAVPKMDYRLGFGDVVDVKFLGIPEYNETVTVRPDGRISLQGVGDVDALGLTPAELDALLTAQYAEILVNPNVTVIVKNFGGQKCYVAGEVDRPGGLDVDKGMTLLRAIAAAGGPKKSAKMSSVILIRMDPQQRAEATRLDLSYTSGREGLMHDLPVSGNDIIYVPKTFIADVGAFVSQIYDIVLPPFDSWTRYYYWYRGNN